MSVTILIGAISVLAIAGIFIFFDVKIHAMKRTWEKEKEVERKKDELKEEMETGDSNGDFDASVRILHDLAGDKWGKKYS